VLLEGLHFVNKLGNLFIKLGRAEGHVEDVGVLAATDHTLLKLCAVLCHNIFNALLLQSCCRLEVFHTYFTPAEVSHCAFKVIVLTTALDDVVDQLG